MVLSRFWLVIFVASIAFVIFSLFSGDSYSIDYVLNGKKDDPILISEKYLNEIPKFIQDSIQKSEEKSFVINRDTLNADTTYVYKNQTVKVTGKTAVVRHELHAKTNDSGKPGEAHIGVMLVWQKEGSTWKLLGRQAFKLPV